jgi:hypothetical protein
VSLEGLALDFEEEGVALDVGMAIVGFEGGVEGIEDLGSAFVHALGVSRLFLAVLLHIVSLAESFGIDFSIAIVG